VVEYPGGFDQYKKENLNEIQNLADAEEQKLLAKALKKEEEKKLKIQQIKEKKLKQA
jgi:hypothetical protein